MVMWKDRTEYLWQIIVEVGPRGRLRLRAFQEVCAKWDSALREKITWVGGGVN